MVLAAAVLAVGGLVATAFFLDLGRAHFWDPGEGRYAEAVREMLLTGNWIVPTLNFAHYYDKPPGFFWMVAAAFRLFGQTEWAARLPAVCAAIALIVATVAFAWRRLGPAASLGAGSILATAGAFVVLGRSVRMDMILALTVGATLFHAYTLWADEDGPGAAHSPAPRTWPLYVLPAFGLLVKGPIAIILPVLVLGAFTAVTGEYARLRRLRPGFGLAVALVIASSWYAIAAVHAPDYLWTFLWRQNVDRFLEGTSGSGHSEPLWFYLWVLPVTFLPWTLFLPGAARRAVQRARRGEDLDLFLLTWIVVVFVFFTLSNAKLADVPPADLPGARAARRGVPARDRRRARAGTRARLPMAGDRVGERHVRRDRDGHRRSGDRRSGVQPPGGMGARAPRIPGRRGGRDPAAALGSGSALVLLSMLASQVLFYRAACRSSTSSAVSTRRQTRREACRRRRP